jgi:hypothetical protein
MSYYDDVFLAPPDEPDEEDLLREIEEDEEDQEPSEYESAKSADTWEKDKETLWSCNAIGVRPVGR